MEIDIDDLLERLQDEADRLQDEGANDIARLLKEAAICIWNLEKDNHNLDLTVSDLQSKLPLDKSAEKA